MRTKTLRTVALGALAAAVAVVLITLKAGGGPYTLKITFADAGQMIEGADVEIGGRVIGTVKQLKLTPDWRAQATVELNGAGSYPVRQGTTAQIRAVGQSGVTNRFIELHPGPSSAPQIPSGGSLPASAATGIVDLDVVLDSIGPSTRAHLRSLIKNSATSLDGTSADLNGTLRLLHPTSSAALALGDELTADTRSLGRLIVAGADVSSVLAGHSRQVTNGIAGTAATLQALADHRSALGRSLAQLPAVLRQTETVSRHARTALRRIRPVLAGTKPVIAPLTAVLRHLRPATAQTLPALRQLNGLLPVMREGFSLLPALSRSADPALRATGEAVGADQDIFKGLREYGPELVFGAVLGVGGTTTAGYDAAGHYARLTPMVGLKGPSGIATAYPPLADSIDGTRTKRLRRCPGNAAPPADDGSSPWEPEPGACDPSQGPQ
jgi:phospholipid/cholesterol/gamma-HCH transport system substrate-binding protein